MFENILISNILVKKYICFYETDGVMNSKPSNCNCTTKIGLELLIKGNFVSTLTWSWKKELIKLAWNDGTYPTPEKRQLLVIIIF